MVATACFLHAAHIGLTCFHVTGRPKVFLPFPSLTVLAVCLFCSLFWLVAMERYIYIFTKRGSKLFYVPQCSPVLSQWDLNDLLLSPLSFLPYYLHLVRWARRVGGQGREFDRFEIRWQQLWNSRVFANIPMRIKIYCEKSSMSLELHLSLVFFFKEYNVS